MRVQRKHQHPRIVGSVITAQRIAADTGRDVLLPVQLESDGSGDRARLDFLAPELVTGLRIVRPHFLRAAAALEHQAARCGERASGGTLVLLSLPHRLAGGRVPGL